MKIFLPESRLCVYPDATVVCGTSKYLDEKRDVLLNPTLVVEVLSPSTQTYDKGSKALYYRSLPSLWHCLLIAQDRTFVEHSAGQKDGTWKITAHKDSAGVIRLPELELDIALSDVYEGIGIG